MKAFSERSLREKLKIQAKREVEACFRDKYDEVAVQMVALMLYALSLHGYGTKRLNDMYGWFLNAANMPEIFGSALRMEDCMEFLQEKHGIDFSKLHVHVEGLEENK